MFKKIGTSLTDLRNWKEIVKDAKETIAEREEKRVPTNQSFARPHA